MRRQLVSLVPLIIAGCVDVPGAFNRGDPLDEAGPKETQNGRLRFDAGDGADSHAATDALAVSDPDAAGDPGVPDVPPRDFDAKDSARSADFLETVDNPGEGSEPQLEVSEPQREVGRVQPEVADNIPEPTETAPDAEIEGDSALPLDIPQGGDSGGEAGPTPECVQDQDCMEDGDLCSSPVCVDGECGASPLDCDDGNSCTSDACDPLVGCVFTPDYSDPTCPCGELGVACPEGFYCVASDNPYCAGGVLGLEVYVPAGDFWMGCNEVLDAPCAAGELPQHLVGLSGYAILRTEVSVADYKSCVSAGECTPTAEGPDATYPDEELLPVNHVTWAQAAAFCDWRDMRLCTEAEWERAARGGCEMVEGDCKSGMATFPWGEGSPSEPVCDVAWFLGCTAEPGPVESLVEGASPYGALNLAGNVQEWTSNWLDLYNGCSNGCSDPSGPTEPALGELRIVRGGGFTEPTESLRAARRTAVDPSFSQPAVGIRCCRDVD